MTMRQIAALPYRSEGEGLDAPIRILLITSRETKRWVIPKGNPMSGLPAHLAAAAEAQEEAGIVGAVCPTPLGSYRYRKRRRNGASLMVDVEVFPLAVAQELPDWKERHQRERRWFSLAEAVEAVEESDLGELIGSFAASEFTAATRRATLIGTVAHKSGVGRMFGWFQKLLPKQVDFFDLFEAHVQTIVSGADALSRLFHDSGHRADHIREVIEREKDADEVIRQVLHLVRATFLTPFDRSEIISLISSMDDAIDEMEAAVAAVDLYDVVNFDQDMKDMAAIVVDSSRVLAEAMPLIRDVGRNAKRLHELTERLVRMEGHADAIHAAGLKNAFAACGPNDAMGFLVRQEIFKHLERIMDAMEDVANVIDGIVVDHS